MRAIITGGTGLIGQALVKNLMADGYEVVVLSRSSERPADLPTAVQLAVWDARTPQGWGHLVDGAEVVIHLAGASVVGEPLPKRWTAERKKLIRDSRVDSTQAVVAAIGAATQKPRLLVQASAVGYYGTYPDDTLITEESPSGDDFLASVCRDWEAASAPVETLGVRRVVLRTGLLFAAAGGSLAPLILPFRLFAGGPVGSGRQWMPWIHVADELGAIRFLMADEQTSGAYNLMAPNPVSNKEFAQLVGRLLHRPAFVPTPEVAMKAALGELAMILTQGQRAVPQRLLAAGYTFQYPDLEPALRDLLLKK